MNAKVNKDLEFCCFNIFRMKNYPNFSTFGAVLATVQQPNSNIIIAHFVQPDFMRPKAQEAKGQRLALARVMNQLKKYQAAR